MKNKVQLYRLEKNMTQSELAEKSGLSLRTIQRLEATNKEPKGHTLNVLLDVYKIEPMITCDNNLSAQQHSDSDILAIKLINLSVFAFLGIPFGNIIFPILMWRKKRQSKLVDEIGRKIINFQIFWSVLLSFLLCISPFITKYLFPTANLILIVLFTAVAINIGIVCFTAILLQRNNLNFINSPIKFL